MWFKSLRVWLLGLGQTLSHIGQLTSGYLIFLSYITLSGDRDREIGDGATERHTEKGKE